MDRIRVGDRVLVPKGFDEVEATVIEVYGPDDSYVLLMVPLLGAEGEVLDEYTLSLPVSRVRRVATT